MVHGNIYPAEKVPDALTHFFRSENLVALRELALRFVADETEEELLAYLRDRHSDALWETRERIIVAVTGAHGTDAVIRRAARIAARSKADLHAVYVVAAESGPAAPADGLDALHKLADDLGAEWHVLRWRTNRLVPSSTSPASTRSPRSSWGRAAAVAGRSSPRARSSSASCGLRPTATSTCMSSPGVTSSRQTGLNSRSSRRGHLGSGTRQ